MAELLRSSNLKVRYSESESSSSNPDYYPSILLLIKC